MDAKLVTAMYGCLTGELSRKVNVKTDLLQSQGKMRRGRQVIWMLYHHFSLNAVDGKLMEVTDLIRCEMKGDNLSQFIDD